MMRVIVNADDFGLCPEVNDAVCMLHDRGVVHRTSLIVTTHHFDESVKTLRCRPALGVALHLNLTDGPPVLPAGEVRSLLGRNGLFLGGRHYAVAAAIAAGRMSRRQIGAEWRAQIARARDAGIAITQLNSHGHLHLLPQLRGLVLDLLKEFAIPELRAVLAIDSARSLLLALCSAGIGKAAHRRGLRITIPDRVLGLGAPGSLDPARLRKTLASTDAEGVVELVVHPSLGDNEYHRKWGYAGDQETRTLLAPDAVQLLQARGQA